MIRKIINLIVVFAVIIGISGIFIHLYNNSNRKNLNNKFDTVKETIKKKKNKNKKNDTSDSENNKSNDNSEEDSNNSSKDVELDDDDVSNGDNDDIEENSDNNINGSEISVGSTGTKENIYISLVGGIIIISGAGLILKLNKNRVC